VILVDQTLFGDKNGNCFPACVASITGIPLEEIPNFCVEHPGDNEWFRAFAKWLGSRGWAPIAFVFNDGARAHLDYAREIAPGAPWIASGLTSRGRHAVVYVGAELFHDPNPRHGRAGIDSVEDGIYLVRAVTESGEAP
jgi:hypothetical protein